MVIHTFEHEYPISHVKEISDVLQSYICRNSAEGGLCRILAVADKSLFAGIIPGLADAAGSSAFSDFIEHFICDDVLCIVMRYTQGITLRDKLETESFSLAEKLELGRRILERMILQEIPDYYLTKCCSEENIIVDSDLTLHFNYPIEDIVRAGDCTRADAMAGVAALLRYIFAREADDYSSAELSRFLDTLPALCAESDLIGLYSAYHEMMQAATSGEAKSNEENSIWHSLWEKLKKVGFALRKVLMVLLLLAAAIYLIYTIGETKDSGTRIRNFERIGTVEIK